MNFPSASHFDMRLTSLRLSEDIREVTGMVQVTQVRPRQYTIQLGFTATLSECELLLSADTEGTFIHFISAVTARLAAEQRAREAGLKPLPAPDSIGRDALVRQEELFRLDNVEVIAMLCDGVVIGECGSWEEAEAYMAAIYRVRAARA